MSAIRTCVALLVMHAACAGAAELNVAPSAASTAESASLGRLFYTPAQRAALDEMRRRPQRGAQEERVQRAPAPEYVTLNGIVRRSDGTTTVWLNDKQVRGRETEDGLQVTPSRRAATPSGVTVRIPQTGRVVDLKVGQQLEVNSGQVKEGYRSPPRPSAEASAEAPATQAAQEASTLRDRRASREREALRDLLREIDGPPAGNERNGSPPAPASAR